MRDIKSGNISFKVDDHAHESHWNSIVEQTWQPWIWPIYDWLLDKDKCYIDFGAWIGATTLYAARKARHVYAFEPDPVAFDILKGNVGCNSDIKNVTLINSAIWVRTGMIGVSSETGSLGNSDTSIFLDHPEASAIAKTIRFEDFRRDLLDIEDCNLIKFDIEGAEFAVLSDMLPFFEEKRPSIIVSVHHERVNDAWGRAKELAKSLRFYQNCYNVGNMQKSDLGVSGNILLTDRKWKE